MGMVINPFWSQAATVSPVEEIAADGATFPFYGAVHSPAFYDSGFGYTFLSWEAWTGVRSEEVTILDHSTGYFTEIEGMGSSPLPDDDHGNPNQILLDHEDYLHAFYGAHGDAVPQSTGMRHSVTRWPIDGSPVVGSHWRIDPEITGLYAYAHALMVSSTMYLFMRKTISASSKHTLVLYKTTSLSGGVATWGAETSIVDFGTDSRVYMGPAFVVGTKIHFVASKSPNVDTIREHVYYFVYDTVNGDLENHDSSFSVASGSLPMGLSDANTNCRLFAHSGGNGGITPYLAFDTNGDPLVAFTDGSGSSYPVKVIKRTAGTWASPETTGASADNRFDGPAIGQLPSGEMELFYADDPTSAWTRGGNMTRRVRSSGGSWGSAQTILQATSFALGNPQVVKDGHTNARLMFCEHRQDSLDATAGGLKIYLWGAGGFVGFEQAPEPATTTTNDGNELREDNTIELREDNSNELREVPV